MNRSKKKFSIKNGFKPFYIKSWRFRLFIFLILIFSIYAPDYLKSINYDENFIKLSMITFSISLILSPFTQIIKYIFYTIRKIGIIRLNRWDDDIEESAKSFLLDTGIFGVELLIFLFGITIFVGQIIFYFF